MSRHRFVIAIALLVHLLVASSVAGDAPALEGRWVAVGDATDHFVLSKFGKGLAFETAGKKFPAVYERGKLVISMSSGPLTGLYDKASDHIMIDGAEYRRGTAADRGMGSMKKTLADIRSIAIAWEARATDTNTYAIEGGDAVSAERLEQALMPTYIRTLPTRDGWGNKFEFATNPDGLAYWIRSCGANGKRDDTPDGETTDPNADIVFTNGTFVAYPKSAQNWK